MVANAGNVIVHRRTRVSNLRNIMETISSKVTSKGQVVIPKKLRDKYGIRTATAIRWIEKDQGILMVPESEDPIMAARGMLKGSGILKAFMKEKSREKQKENKRIARSK
jgi:AbrB family looped-hinge helix DNA binding protein